MFVVFDLDGTLTITKHRDHLAADAEDWDAYHAACVDDEPICPILVLFERLVQHEHVVAIWTGRKEAYRQATMEWLAQHTVTASREGRHYFRFDLEMTPDDDNRGANIVKAEWLAQYARKPDLAFDDRADCVRWWREQGVLCLDVAGHGY